MAKDRETRRLLNTKQDIIEFKGIPSTGNLENGQIAFAKDPTGQLALYRKYYGKLWKSYLSQNGDQVIDRDLKVGGSLTVRGNLKGTRAYFGGGNASAMTSTGYLKSFNGLTMSSTIGYRMLRDGSVTGVSANYNITDAGTDGIIRVRVFKGGTSVFHATNANISGTGMNSISATQARYVDVFSAGDIMSLNMELAVEAGSDYPAIDDIIAYFEVVFND
tara:strand:- start:47 stop:703 length:657 start_codon:yes stop_codon:yes gene_type:complete